MPPDTSKLEPLTPELRAWFAARGISAATLARNGVACEWRYCPPLKAVVPHIAFPYRRGASAATALACSVPPLQAAAWCSSCCLCGLRHRQRALACMARAIFIACSLQCTAGEVVNIKYRALPKHFSQSKGGQQVFWGCDDVQVRAGRAAPATAAARRRTSERMHAA